ncbi:MAG TPA: hypothetical protein ENG51_01145 [Deltaproteobacteria bacterium]|nr:MAG: hypothetical protein DRJ03_23940 [Chloroflexota bacterium]HDM75059.1 hypothetical protein [Deltaproteobacteria bacterium]
MREKLGALWEKESRDGKKYLSGSFEEKRITVFANTRKRGKSPHLLVFEAGIENGEVIGKLWKNCSNGKTYYTGEVFDTKVIIFNNKNGRSENAPDWVIYRHRATNDQEQVSETEQTAGENSGTISSLEQRIENMNIDELEVEVISRFVKVLRGGTEQQRKTNLVSLLMHLNTYHV